jgi:hypothetical protein
VFVQWAASNTVAINAVSNSAQEHASLFVEEVGGSS